jgi:hypothetical protein
MLPNLKRTVRKIHPLVPLTVLLFGLFAGLALVQRVQDIRQRAQTVVPEPNFVISPSTQTLKPGDSFNFSVIMNTGSSSIVGFDIDLDFNPQAMEVTGITKGSGIGSFDQEIRKTYDNAVGKISYSAFTLDLNLAVSGSNLQVLSVAGRVKSNATEGNYNITFAGTTSMADVNANNVLAGTGPGTITVASPTTSTPTPTPGQIFTTMLENFESYSSSTELQQAYTKDGNTNSLNLNSTFKADGLYGGVFDYTVGTPDYSGVYKTLNNDSWTGNSAISFWIRPDGSNRLFAVRLRESGGEEWEGRVTLTGTSASTVQIPFNNFILVKPSSTGNGSLDLGSISAFGFYVHKGQSTDGSGRIYLDKFELTSDSGEVIPTAGPTPTPGPTSAFTPTPTSGVVQPADTTLSISPATLSVNLDNAFQLSTNINTGINEVVGVDLTVNFDKNRLEVTNIVPGGFFSNPTESIKTIDNTNGVIKYSLHIAPGTAAKKGTGTLAVISFRAKGEGNAAVTIPTSTTIVGAVNTGAKNALKSTTGGTVSITKILLLGDINEDGKVDILDYVILFENYGKSPIPDPRADINKDGKVDILDYVILFENFGRTI